MAADLSLAGVFPPIPTPFDDDENLVLDRLGENLERWQKVPLAGYVVGGSNGEFVSLSQKERLEVLQYVCECVGSERTVIAGSGLHSTRETIFQTEAMAEVGAHAALVVTPSYYKNRMEPAALIAHYTEIANQSSIPIILYNVPVYTGLNMSAETILPLSEHDNIIGIKDSSGDIAKMADIVLRAPNDFQVLTGSASSFLGAMTVGVVGTISSLANLAGEELEALIGAFKSGALETAARMQQNLVRPNIAVTSKYGIPGLKFALTLKGYYGGIARSPLQPLTKDQKVEIETIFKEAELI